VASAERTFAWLVIHEMESDSRYADALEKIAVAVFAAGASPNHQLGTGRRKVYLIERAALRGRPALIDAMVEAGLDVKGEGTGRLPRTRRCRRRSTVCTPKPSRCWSARAPASGDGMEQGTVRVPCAYPW
jgi:hypothetical protein